MIRSIIKALLGPIFTLAESLLSATMKHPRELVIALLACFILAQNVRTIPSLRADIARVRAQLADETRAHDATLAAIVQARRVAEELDRERIARVQRESAAAMKAEREKYEIRLADHAARADRLQQRLDAARRGQSGGGDAPVPALSDATCRIFGAADCDQLAARLTDAQRSIDKLIGLQSFIATAHDIDEAINWEGSDDVKAR